MSEVEFDELGRQALGGDAEAGLGWGKRLLVGDDAPFDPARGAQAVESAAKGGSLEAMRLSATLAAAGIGRPQDWSEALRGLERAAAAGDDHCRRQLQLLASCPDGAAERPLSPGLSWSELRERVDVEAWLRPAERRPACEAPRIREVDAFLAPSVCQWMIERAQTGLRRATMFNPTTRRDEPHPGRTNRAVVFDLFRADVVVALIRARIGATVRIPPACFEPTQVFHYAAGEMIAGHYDYLEHRDMTAYGSGERYDGQRVATFLVYLNDAYDGGETVFPKVDYRFKGRAGAALFFANVDAGGQPERLSLHAGAPPTRGEKWIISQWIHDRPFTGVSA